MKSEIFKKLQKGVEEALDMERGEALIEIHFLHDKISVRNEIGELLLERQTSEGFWDDLWQVIRHAD